MKTKHLLLLAATGGAAIIVVAVAFPRWRARRPADPPAAARAAEGPSVRTIIVRPQPMDESILATGTVRADESVEVRSEIPGKVMKIHFQEGTPVRAGELLVTINDAELRASRQRAVYRHELAEVKTLRLARLKDQGGVTQQDYDIAVSEMNVLAAEVALIEAQLSHTEIRAPFDGVVGLRTVSEGAFVTSSMKIATFQRLDRLKVDFSIPEKYAYRISPDSTVSVTLAGTTRPLTGKIHAIEPLVDAATRTIQVRALCANPSGRSFSGGFVSVRLRLAQISDAILVPALAIVPGANEQSVFIVENGLAKRRFVRTGTRTDSAVQVVEGLSSGDLVIVSGLQLVRTGQPVKTLHDDAPPPGGMITKLEHQTAALN